MKNEPDSLSRIYFAARDPDDMVRALMERVELYEKFCKDCGIWYVWRRAYRAYYGMPEDSYGYGYGMNGYEVGRGGEQGELAKIKINHFRNLLTHYLTLATPGRIAFDPIARADTYAADAEVKLAKSWLTYDLQRGLEAAIDEAEEFSVFCGDAFLAQRWNPHAGDVLVPALAPPAPDPSMPASPDAPKPAPSAPVFQGDIEWKAYSPLDLIRDPRHRSGNPYWWITRTWINKFELAAVFPTKADEILAVKSKPDLMDFSSASFDALSNYETDEIPVYEFWHNPRPQVSAGVRMLFINGTTWLEVGDLSRYKEARLRRVQVADLKGTIFGFSPAWDLLAPQEAVDTLSSIALSNQKTFGVANILVPKGHDIAPTQLATGLNMIEYQPGLAEPKVLQLTATPKEVFDYRIALVGEMETVIGVNSVVRGNPEASLKSGQALALVQAQAVQFSSKFQGNIVRFREAVGTDNLAIVKEFMDSERTVSIVDDQDALEILQVKGDKMGRVERVKVDVANALTKTVAGRVQIGEYLNNSGLIKDPRQLVRVLEDGNLDALTKSTDLELSNIQRENELLLKGIGAPPPPPPPGMPPAPQPPGAQYVNALIFDNHRLHAQEHLTVLMSPQARENPAITQAVLSHVQAHLQMLTQATLQNPAALELTNQAPLQTVLAQQQAMMAQQQAASQPPGKPGEGPPERGPSRPMQKGEPGPTPAPPAPGASSGAPMPTMPKNLNTGQRVEMPPTPMHP